jgi:hypothetical protein
MEAMNMNMKAVMTHGNMSMERMTHDLMTHGNMKHETWSMNAQRMNMSLKHEHEAIRVEHGKTDPA